MSVRVNRRPVYFYPDPKRVIARPFIPGGPERVAAIARRVIDQDDGSVKEIIYPVLRDFSKRHRNISKTLEGHFAAVEDQLVAQGIEVKGLSHERKLLIGAYFTSEYSIESAAFFNPSIVADPYQGTAQDGQQRIIVSFRATGEGHVSSIVFRSAVVDQNNDFSFEPAGPLVDVPEVVKRHVYDKRTFIQKCRETQVYPDVIERVMSKLGDSFIYGELQAAIDSALKDPEISDTKREKIKTINWVASSHYEMTFSLDTSISERVIFPISYAESNGIEDARFVRFVDTTGEVTYYATYTAYNGYAILPKLLETKDFYHFKVIPIHGEKVQNKGMALFPRKIGGKYAMISRHDGVNIYLNYSDTIHIWQETALLAKPVSSWEFVQIGNCGSPIETDEGWLLIIHGVGPMRQYALGAALLDLEDPLKVIGHLEEPLITANEKEREGYVPNVVYSCGSIVHNGELIIPYGIADSATTFATVSLSELLDELLGRKR